MDTANSLWREPWVKTMAKIALIVVAAGVLAGLFFGLAKLLEPIGESRAEKRFEARVERFHWATPECFGRVFGPADARRRWLAIPKNVQQTEGLLGLCQLEHRVEELQRRLEELER